MSYAIRLPDQLKQHLRALRKSRGLTQARLGALVGVKQARIAEIEANPGAVSLDQLSKVLAALGGTLHLHRANAPDAGRGDMSAPGPTAAPARTAKKVSGSPVAQRSPTVASKSAPRARVVIRPKKGSW